MTHFLTAKGVKTFNLLSGNLFKTCCEPTGTLMFAHLGLFVCICVHHFQAYWGFVLNTLMKCSDKPVVALCK